MDDAVPKLVDDVLTNAPAALREACSCRGVLAGLETAGAFDVKGRTLRTLLEKDYAEVKQSISGAALPAFVARLKEATVGIHPARFPGSVNEKAKDDAIGARPPLDRLVCPHGLPQ